MEALQRPRRLSVAAPAGRAARLLAVAVPLALLGPALAVWARALDDVNIRDVGDAGLAPSVPVAAYVATAVVLVAFVFLAVRERAPDAVLGVMLLVLVVLLHGMTPVVEEVPSFNVSWRHSGVADHILQTGEVDRSIDAYFNWPGFFALLALATDAAGLDSPMGFVQWAPLVFNALYLAPMLVIARSLTSRRRTIWLAALVFVLGNWVRQDYLSPQALAYLMYLCLLAVVLAWFSKRSDAMIRTRSRWRAAVGAIRARGTIGLNDPTTPAQRMALALVAIAAVLVVVPMHQLTPFAACAALLALVWVDQCRLRLLPLIAIVATLGWLVLFAEPFLAGHAEQLREQIGDIASLTSANVGSRVRGAEEHVTIVRLRLLFTAALWAAAALAAFLRFRSRRPVVAIAAVGVAPFPLLALQPYGGEMLLRVYLFALPATAFLVGSLMSDVSNRLPTWLRGAAVSLAVAAMAAAFMFARYGNEQVTLFTPAEVDAIEWVYDVAPRETLLVAPARNLAWQDRYYATYDYETLGSAFEEMEPPLPPSPAGSTLANAVVAFMEERQQTDALFVVTRSLRNYDRLLGAHQWGSVADLERALRRSPRFAVAFENPDATIYRLLDRGQGRW